jgi:hypothetical protein
LRIYLTRFKEDYAAINATYRSYFPPDRLPAPASASPALPTTR